MRSWTGRRGGQERGGDVGGGGQRPQGQLERQQVTGDKGRGGGAQRVRMQEANGGEHGRELNGGGGRGGATGRLQAFQENKHNSNEIMPQSLMKYSIWYLVKFKQLEYMRQMVVEV